MLTLELFENLSREVGIVIISHNKLIIERFSENILLMSNGNLTPFLGASENLEKEVISTEKIHEKLNTSKDIILLIELFIDNALRGLLKHSILSKRVLAS